ncbi:MAG TPA: hypothetical protein VIU12_20410 [Chryseolinea sp.]
MQKTNTSSWTSTLMVMSVLFASLVLSVCSSSVQTKKTGKTQNGPCIDSTKIDLNGPCIMIYAPVCGCNNVTYDNECLATRSGVLHWKEGKCK